MADNDDRFHDGGSRELSDETIRRFLLGGLSVSERPLFEQRLISDDDLDTRARLIEVDLADDYAYQHLSASDRKLFEQNFLVTQDRQVKLRVSKVLRARFSSPTVTAIAATSKKNTIPEKVAHLLALVRPAWRIAFGILLLLVLFGTVLLLIKEPRLTERIANKIIPRRSTLRKSPREVNHPTNTSSPEHQTTPSPMPAHDSAIQSAGSLLLFPATTDPGTVPRVTLSHGEKDVLRLRLAVIAHQAASYRAEVLTIDGQSVLSVDVQGPRFDLDVPMRLLKRGKYRVRLSDAGDGSKKDATSYYFLVR